MSNFALKCRSPNPCETLGDSFPLASVSSVSPISNSPHYSSSLSSSLHIHPHYSTPSPQSPVSKLSTFLPPDTLPEKRSSPEGAADSDCSIKYVSETITGKDKYEENPNVKINYLYVTVKVLTGITYIVRIFTSRYDDF